MTAPIELYRDLRFSIRKVDPIPLRSRSAARPNRQLRYEAVRFQQLPCFSLRPGRRTPVPVTPATVRNHLPGRDRLLRTKPARLAFLRPRKPPPLTLRVRLSILRILASFDQSRFGVGMHRHSAPLLRVPSDRDRRLRGLPSVPGAAVLADIRVCPRAPRLDLDPAFLAGPRHRVDQPAAVALAPREAVVAPELPSAQLAESNGRHGSDRTTEGRRRECMKRSSIPRHRRLPDDPR